MRAGETQDGNVTGPSGFCCLVAASGFEPLPSGRDIIPLGHCNSQLGDSAVGQYSARWRCRIRQERRRDEPPLADRSSRLIFLTTRQCAPTYSCGPRAWRPMAWVHDSRYFKRWSPSRGRGTPSFEVIRPDLDAKRRSAPRLSDIVAPRPSTWRSLCQPQGDPSRPDAARICRP